MISLNGLICDSSKFDWIHDSGFRYGYGCFETMRFYNNTVPFFDYHYNRLSQSLIDIGITYQTPKQQLLNRIEALFNAIQFKEEEMICRVYISGGNVHLQPDFETNSNEIITLQPIINSPVNYGIEWVTFSPDKFYRLKSMNYAHHLLHLKSTEEWPIYVDNDDVVIDSSIFAIGIIKNDELIFAKHNFQLPSVSRQIILENIHDISITYQPLRKIDLTNADSIIGCNAIKGLFLLEGLDHSMIKTINQLFKPS